MPVTSSTLVNYAEIARGAKKPEWYNKLVAGNIIEAAYEEWLGVDRNVSMEFPNNVRSQSVRPDFVLNSYDERAKGRSKDFTTIVGGTFFEVKGTANGVSLQTSNKQIEGELDALSRRTSILTTVNGKDIFALNFVLILPAGTKIDQGIISKANDLNIKIWTSYMYKNINTGGFVFSNFELVNKEILPRMGKSGITHTQLIQNGQNNATGAFIKDWMKVIRETYDSNEATDR